MQLKMFKSHYPQKKKVNEKIRCFFFFNPNSCPGEANVFTIAGFIQKRPFRKEETFSK